MASRNAKGERVLEHHLDQELQLASTPRWTRGPVQLEGRKRNYPFEGWDPLPGGPDLVFYDADDRVLLIENKWSLDGDNVQEVANDLFKLTAAFSWDRFVAGYLVVGAPTRLWDRPTTCADWFPPAGETRMLEPVGWINQNTALLSSIRALSAGRPTISPESVQLTGVAVVDLEIAGKFAGPEPWQLRCARVTVHPGAAIAVP